MDVFPILYSVGIAVVYSLLVYAKNISSEPEKFDWTKFLVTVILGAFVGATLSLSGNPITKESVETQVVAYGFLTVLIENVLKTILRRFGYKKI